MPRNSSNTYDITRGAGGPPAPDPSTYPAELLFNDGRPDSNSENRLAQNSTSNASHQYNDNNRGASSASRGSSSSNATSGQSYRHSQGDGYSSSSSNRNPNDNRDFRSFTNVQRPLGNTNTGFQSYGGTTSSSSPLSDSTLAGRATRSRINEPWDPIGNRRSATRGGSGDRGSAGEFYQSGGSGREYEYGDGDGDEDSLEAVQGSEYSRRSSGSRR